MLNMPTLAVQIASTEPECALLLNVFAKKDGVSFQIQNRKAVSDVEYETLMTRLNFWVQLERTHRAINAPINLQAGIEILRRELMRCEIELSILAAGDWQLEFVLLREPQSATVRSMWKNIGILSKIKGHQGATELTEHFLRIAQSIWPELQV